MNRYNACRPIDPCRGRTQTQAMRVAPCTTPPVMPQEPVLAMAYVPWQVMTNIYEPARALAQGTIFPELALPFCGRRVSR